MFLITIFAHALYVDFISYFSQFLVCGAAELFDVFWLVDI